MSREFDVLNEIEGLSELMGVSRPRESQRPAQRAPQSARNIYEDYVDSRRTQSPRPSAPAPRRTETRQKVYEDRDSALEARRRQREQPTQYEEVNLVRVVAQLARLQERNQRELQDSIDAIMEQMNHMVTEMSTRFEMAVHNFSKATIALEEAAHNYRQSSERHSYREPPAFSDEEGAFLEEAIAASPPLGDGSSVVTYVGRQSDDT